MKSTINANKINETNTKLNKSMNLCEKKEKRNNLEAPNSTISGCNADTKKAKRQKDEEIIEQKSKKIRSSALARPLSKSPNSCLTDSSPSSCSFNNGLIPEKIIGATDCVNGKLMFLIKWENSNKADLVLSTAAKIICPQLVINFYEDHLIWNDMLGDLRKK